MFEIASVISLSVGIIVSTAVKDVDMLEKKYRRCSEVLPHQNDRFEQYMSGDDLRIAGPTKGDDEDKK